MSASPSSPRSPVHKRSKLRREASAPAAEPDSSDDDLDPATTNSEEDLESVDSQDDDDRKPPARAGPTDSPSRSPSPSPGPAPRKHIIYFGGSVQPAASNKDRNAATYEALKKFFRALQEVDDSAVLCDPSDGTSSATVALETADALGRSIAQFRKIFLKARVAYQPTDKVNFKVLVGFDTDVQDFVSSARDHIRYSIGGSFYQCDLQVPETMQLGWLAITHRQTHCESYGSLLNSQIPQAAKRRGLAFGVRVRPIYQGTSNSSSNSYQQGIKAVHVEIPAGLYALGKEVLQQILDSDMHRSYTNYRPQLMPVYDYKMCLATKKGLAAAISFHQRSDRCADSIEIDGILDLDTPLSGVKAKPTLRHLILQMTTDSGDKLFNSIESHWSRLGTKILVYPKKYEDKV